MWKDGKKDGNKKHFICGKMEMEDILCGKMEIKNILCGKMEINNILCMERWK